MSRFIPWAIILIALLYFGWQFWVRGMDPTVQLGIGAIVMLCLFGAYMYWLQRWGE